ncbi:hypothetical protein LOD99_690 [Oopsacas minuta]|uniref:tRNA pseudouridine synthase n=1 Tax=Oopsacas minuta TaxID=111878 RepID=A0AAV7JZE9_9METZ|nr:hypothetical protein LOD99_690 [Oopsacas minuta]
MKRKLSTDEQMIEPTAKKTKKIFDFSLYNLRHVAFKIAYLGQNYSGFAIQPHEKNTIEEELFRAFIECKLISSRTTCNYSRCGRTDKGVSAVGQVIALHVRSNLREGLGIIPRIENTTEGVEDRVELPYVRMLQAKLPDEIQILSWAPVPIDFSARFSCLFRSYKYYFPKGNFDIEKMQEAALKFEGEHDFRNFCKLDNATLRDFNRHIHKISIRTLDSNSQNVFKFCELNITAKSFLWHQVRYMMGVLTLVGQGRESPDVIDYLLDVEACKAKPNYSPATPDGLILYDSGFEDINWVDSSLHISCIIIRLQRLWVKKSIEECMLRGIIDSIDPSKIKEEEIKHFNLSFDPVTKFPISTLANEINSDISSNRSKYTLLKDRPILKGTSFEERVDRIKKRGKLKNTIPQQTSSND